VPSYFTIHLLKLSSHINHDKPHGVIPVHVSTDTVVSTVWQDVPGLVTQSFMLLNLSNKEKVCVCLV